jgi:hypothetical protein
MNSQLLCKPWSSCAEILVPFGAIRFWFRGGLRWLLNIAALGIVLTPMYALAINYGRLDWRADRVRGGSYLSLHQPNSGLHGSLSGIWMHHCRMGNKVSLHGVFVPNNEQLRVLAIWSRTIFRPVGENFYFPVNEPRRVISVGYIKPSISKTDQQDREEFPSIHTLESYWVPLSNQLGLLMNIVRQQFVQTANFVRYRSIRFSDFLDDVVYVPASLNIMHGSECGPSEISMDMDFANGVCEHHFSIHNHRSFAISDNNNRLIDEERDNRSAVSRNRKKQQQNYRYMRINDTGNSVFTTDQQTGKTVLYLDGGDIDVSVDGKIWFHLGKLPCKYNLPQAPTPPQ